MIKRIRLLVILFLPVCYLQAQVTVGSDIPPQKSAILELKSFESASPGGITTNKDGGGLLLPRIKLSNLNTFEPFMNPLTEPNYSEKFKHHTGMLIYNINEENGFQKGMYIWDGAKWILTRNTLSPEDAWLKTGNSNTTAGQDFLGTTDAKSLSIRTNNVERIHITSAGKVGIGTNAPNSTLQVQGDMTVTNTPTINDDFQLLVINKDGKVGKAAAMPTKLLFIESSTQQLVTDVASFNQASTVVVTWVPGDILISTGLVTFDNSENAFTFEEDAMCEVSGFISYLPRATAPQTYTSNFTLSGIGVNVTVQLQKASTSNWVDVTGARSIWVGGAVNDVVKTISVPPAVMSFKKGDKLRMIFKRPVSNFGMPHHTSGNGGIVPIESGKACKGFKILAI